jgi:hypothetical protein
VKLLIVLILSLKPLNWQNSAEKCIVDVNILITTRTYIVVLNDFNKLTYEQTQYISMTITVKLR